MYAYLWRLLPGPWPVKTVLAVIVLGAVFVVLMEVVFPVISALMPYNQVSVTPTGTN